MYKKLIPLDVRKKIKNNEIYLFLTNEFHFLNYVWGINIFVDLYVSVTPYFCASFDLQEHAIKLRQDNKFREFTKFGFYLMKTIKCDLNTAGFYSRCAKK